MSKINAVCVYCGSSPGTDPAFVEAAQKLGKILAENGVRLVYGGGSPGRSSAGTRSRSWSPILAIIGIRYWH
jgi:predicted Rossmann-fold nucleotide-binding protein